MITYRLGHSKSDLTDIDHECCDLTDLGHVTAVLNLKSRIATTRSV